MGPGERNIQHELRRQAAQVAVPTDMWEKIKGQLDGKRVLEQRQQQVIMRSAQWKPALALAAAVGMLWLTVAPSGPSPEPEAVTAGTPQPGTPQPGTPYAGSPQPVAASSSWGYDMLDVRFYRQAGYDVENVPPEARQTRTSGSDAPRKLVGRTIAIR